MQQLHIFFSCLFYILQFDHFQDTRCNTNENELNTYTLCAQDQSVDRDTDIRTPRRLVWFLHKYIALICDDSTASRAPRCNDLMRKMRSVATGGEMISYPENDTLDTELVVPMILLLDHVESRIVS